MNQNQTIAGVLIAALIFTAAYFMFFRGPSEETPAPAIEEETVMEETTIPAPDNVAAIPEGAKMIDGGIGLVFVQEGDGENFPTLNDDVTIHYTGWQTDGTMFDSSVVRGDPATFPLGRLIQGWQLAMPHMSKGSKALIWIPGPLAYDFPGARPDAPKGMLVFEIELFDFVPSE